MRFTLFIYLISMPFINGFAQQIWIKGVVIDSVTRKPIDYSQLTVLKKNTSQIVDISYTNEQGEFAIALQKKGVFMLKASMLNYISTEQLLLIDDNSDQTIISNFELVQNANELGVIEVVARKPPIVVKSDTIIYDIDQWTRRGDNNLEDVLRNIPGIEVLQDGELKINGKIINKVLIDGQEITKEGAAITTKTITPEMVENIEIRMKDKNTAFKESMLSNNDLVILDIKLKKDVKTSLFGEGKFAAGVQRNQQRFGGYLNLFSITNTVKTHFLAEYDQLGARTISLSQLKNLDKEAYAKVFELPSNFTSFLESQEFTKEIYGFKDYTSLQPGMLGVSFSIPVHKHLSCYVASYNTYLQEELQDNTRQFYITQTTNTISQIRKNTDFNTKNKFTLTFTPTSKFRVENNFIVNFNYNRKNNANTEFDSHTNYQFLKTKGIVNYLNNLKLEIKFSDKFGFHTNAIYSLDQGSLHNALQHNNLQYTLFYDTNGELITDFQQDISLKETLYGLNSFFQYHAKFITLLGGVRGNYNELTTQKNPYYINGGAKQLWEQSIFTGNRHFLKSWQYVPYFSLQYQKNRINWSNKVGLTINSFPNFQPNKSNTRLLEIESNFIFTISNFDNVGILYKRNASIPAMYKLSQGAELIDFQTINIPNNFTLVPRPTQIVQLTYSSSLLKDYGIGILYAGLYGNSYENNRVSTQYLPLIGTQYDQLRGQYLINTLILSKVFDKYPISLKLEPFFLVNKTKNIDESNGNIYFIISKIQGLKFYLKYDVPHLPMSIDIATKYQQFTFSTDTPNINSQLNTYYIETPVSIHWTDFLLTKIAPKVCLIESNSTTAKLTLLNIKISFTKFKYQFHLEADNLFDSKYFIKRELLPIMLIENKRNIFGRYIKLVVTYKF
ncbi:MAG: hypothetical protein KA974_09505 [Saprospiraceae bacterium]|nr:hypothetical protein [Saprospiraceae bacterium]MBP7699544.1 hypothetical protein [Saprospiraceae bacterium]